MKELLQPKQGLQRDVVQSVLTVEVLLLREESKISIMKLRNFLVFCFRVSGNSNEMKVKSIHSQDERIAQTRWLFCLPFRTAFKFYGNTKTDEVKMFDRQKFLWERLRSFINFPDILVKVVLECPPPTHKSTSSPTTFFIFMVNYTNTNEPLILLNSYDARSEFVPFYGAIYKAEHSMLANNTNA